MSKGQGEQNADKQTKDEQAAMQTTKTIDKPYKLPFGGILEHDEKGTSAINSS
jgi:hypothetical protein